MFRACRKLILILGMLVVISSVGASELEPFSNVDVCSKLLVQAELGTTSHEIEATIYHALAIDYPVLFGEDMNRIVFEVMLDFFREVTPPNGSYTYAPIGRGGKKVQFLFAQSAIRLNASSEFAEFMLRDYAVGPFAAKAWEKLKTHSTPLSAREEYRGLDQVIAIIDASERLRKRALAVLEGIIQRPDDWVPKGKGNYATSGDGLEPFYSINPETFYRSASSRSKAVKRFGERYALDALPAITPELMARQTEEILAPAFTELDAAFQAPPDPSLLAEHPGIVAFEADVWKNVQALDVRVATTRDRFIHYGKWKHFYDIGSEWLRIGVKASTPGLKEAFLAAVVEVERAVEEYGRSLRGQIYTLTLADADLRGRIEAVESFVSPASEASRPSKVVDLLVGERKRVAGRLVNSLEEVGRIRETTEKWGSMLESGEAMLAEFRREVSADGISIRDPDAFRKRMENIQSVLDLDPILNKRLEKKWFNLF